MRPFWRDYAPRPHAESRTALLFGGKGPGPTAKPRARENVRIEICRSCEPRTKVGAPVPSEAAEAQPRRGTAAAGVLSMRTDLNT
jgi:hypothetical protein